MDTIARKTSGQNVIDTYRNAIADMHSWFDNLIKKMDVLDRGSGLNCAQKLAAINEVKSDFDEQGPLKMKDLRQKCQDVHEIISNLDGQQVDEQIKCMYIMLVNDLFSFIGLLLASEPYPCLFLRFFLKGFRLFSAGFFEDFIFFIRKADYFQRTLQNPSKVLQNPSRKSHVFGSSYC